MSDVPAEDEAGPADPRVLLANERTMLAWTRTALAFMAVGAAVTQLPGEINLPGGQRAVALPLIVVGAVIGLVSQRTWRRRNAAILRGAPLPKSTLPWLLIIALVATAAIAAAVVLTG